MNEKGSHQTTENKAEGSTEQKFVVPSLIHTKMTFFFVIQKGKIKAISCSSNTLF